MTVDLQEWMMRKWKHRILITFWRSCWQKERTKIVILRHYKAKEGIFFFFVCVCVCVCVCVLLLFILILIWSIAIYLKEKQKVKTGMIIDGVKWKEWDQEKWGGGEFSLGKEEIRRLKQMHDSTWCIGGREGEAGDRGKPWGGKWVAQYRLPPSSDITASFLVCMNLKCKFCSRGNVLREVLSYLSISEDESQLI